MKRALVDKACSTKKNDINQGLVTRVVKKVVGGVCHGLYGCWYSDQIGTSTMDYGLWTTDFGQRTLDYGLWTTDFGLWTTDLDFGLWTLDYGL